MNHTAVTNAPCISDKVIPAQFVRMHDPHATKLSVAQPSPAPKAPDKSKEPKITLHKDGDTIKAIEIVCACGAVIKLDCEY